MQDVEGVGEAVAVRRTGVEVIIGEGLQEGLDVEYDGERGAWTYADTEEAWVVEIEVAAYEDSEGVVVVGCENIPAR